ncbi:hypothetical protein EK21DRAFT_106490 [Setomelanomma holmii]|uniref:Rhodopsin domain-containing protein n=1 Tax=Setomelanomma holmii TaxID=210430 RepID=A0A9P4HL85_9PLEO|nr:hypothetical protein EK21DRAFT_106490 [Setomelanomma holmii]
MNFVDFPVHSDVQSHLIINIVIGCVVFLTVAARLVARKYMGTGIGLDDYFIVCSLPLCYTLLGIQGAFSRLGSGHSITEVMVNVPVILPLTFAFQLFYLLALGIIKTSILCFYTRVFISVRTLLAVKIMYGVVAIWALAHALAVVFICKPVEYQWNLTIAGGKCGDQIKLFQSIITTNILTDVVIMVLPIYTVWHLSMRKTEKVAVTACFLIGILCIIAAILRLYYVTNVDIRGDLTATMPITVFLAAFEPNLAVLCASIPMLRPCYTRYRQRQASKYSSNSSSGMSGEGKNSNISGSRKQRNNNVELDTIHMLEHDIDYKPAADAASNNEDNHTLNGSERNMTPAYQSVDTKRTVWKTRR